MKRSPRRVMTVCYLLGSDADHAVGQRALAGPSVDGPSDGPDLRADHRLALPEECRDDPALLDGFLVERLPLGGLLGSIEGLDRVLDLVLEGLVLDLRE